MKTIIIIDSINCTQKETDLLKEEQKRFIRRCKCIARSDESRISYEIMTHETGRSKTIKSRSVDIDGGEGSKQGRG